MNSPLPVDTVDGQISASHFQHSCQCDRVRTSWSKKWKNVSKHVIGSTDVTWTVIHQALKVVTYFLHRSNDENVALLLKQGTFFAVQLKIKKTWLQWTLNIQRFCAWQNKSNKMHLETTVGAWIPNIGIPNVWKWGFPMVNKTGLQPVSRPVEQSFVFLKRYRKKVQKTVQTFIEIFHKSEVLSPPPNLSNKL